MNCKMDMCEKFAISNTNIEYTEYVYGDFIDINCGIHNLGLTDLPLFMGLRAWVNEKLEEYGFLSKKE